MPIKYSPDGGKIKVGMKTTDAPVDYLYLSWGGLGVQERLATYFWSLYRVDERLAGPKVGLV